MLASFFCAETLRFNGSRSAAEMKPYNDVIVHIMLSRLVKKSIENNIVLHCMALFWIEFELHCLTYGMIQHWYALDDIASHWIA